MTSSFTLQKETFIHWHNSTVVQQHTNHSVGNIRIKPHYYLFSYKTNHSTVQPVSNTPEVSTYRSTSWIVLKEEKTFKNKVIEPTKTPALSVATDMVHLTHSSSTQIVHADIINGRVAELRCWRTGKPQYDKHLGHWLQAPAVKFFEVSTFVDFYIHIFKSDGVSVIYQSPVIRKD